ncbi:MAG: hypothetical protein GXZ11_03935 [Tissierellia bacterium]|nr:hypothetical protein [Tissierellia bacterium]
MAGIDYENLNAVLFYLGDEGEVKDAVLLNTKEMKKLSEEEYKDIIPPAPGGYAEAKIGGKNAIALSTSDESMRKSDALSEMFRIATHEPIHFYYQSEAEITPDSNRTQTYPIDKNERIVRGMLYQNLVLAYENKDKEDEYLGKAKYWLEKWENDHNQAYKEIKYTDIVESTARYAENMGTFIGTATSQEQIDEGANKNIVRDKLFITSDDESYEIGYVAALLLDRRVPDWKNNFYAKGATIDEVLLENVPSISDEVNPELEAKITKGIQEYNEKVGKTIEDLVNLKDNINTPILKLEVSKSTSSMNATDMIRYDEKHVSANYENRFKADGKAIEVKKVNVFEDADEEGNQYIYVPLIMDHEFKDGILTVKGDKLLVDSIKVETLQEDGRTVYLIKVSE